MFSRRRITTFITVLLLTLAFSQTVYAEEFLIPLTQTNVDAAAMGIDPGDVVCLQAGYRTAALRLVNFLGTPEAPIVIKNCGGQTVIDVPPNSDGSLPGYGLAVSNSSYIHLTGTGDPNFEYGIDVAGGVMGVAIGALSKDGIEVDHLRVHDVGFAGIIAKTDPNCDPATWRENFEMRDLRIHDNYVYHTIDGEGFYIGFTFVDGYDITCEGEEITVYGHLIYELDMYNNRTEDTGSEGIQISSSPDGLIHHNVVIDPGVRPFADYQNNGIQINYNNVNVYNNWILRSNNVGLIMFGIGHQVYNNIIIDSVSHGIYADDRKTGEGGAFYHNTVINAGEEGIRLSFDETTPAVVKNNLIANPGGEFFIHGGDVDASNNLFAETLSDAGFVDGAGFDFHLNPDSPAVEGGVEVGIGFDYDDVIRPQRILPDIGAFEWVDNANIQLLQNGTFEAANGDKTPANWKSSDTSTGKIKCNKPDKVIAYQGSCMLQMKALAGGKSKISQTVNNVAIASGSNLSFVAYINGKSIPAATSVGVSAKVIYTNATKEKVSLTTAAGTYDFTEVSANFTTALAVDKIKVQVQYSGASGKVRLDQTSLTLLASDTVIPLPLPPAELQSRQ